MANEPSMQPDSGGTVAGQKETSGFSGTRDGGSDATNEPGQYPPGVSYETELFGTRLPTGTGAPGSQGARVNSGEDPTNQPGQLDEGLSGEGPSETSATGAPGMSTTPNSGGGADSITYTRPGAYLSGTYKSDTVSSDISGPHDATGANDEGYASGGPQLPGIKGNEPQAGDGRYQPGSGRVLRGGRSVRP
jgi:hypothetical protein